MMGSNKQGWILILLGPENGKIFLFELVDLSISLFFYVPFLWTWSWILFRLFESKRNDGVAHGFKDGMIFPGG